MAKNRNKQYVQIGIRVLVLLVIVWFIVGLVTSQNESADSSTSRSSSADLVARTTAAEWVG